MQFCFWAAANSFFLRNLLPVKIDIATSHPLLIDSSGQMTISFEMIRARASEKSAP
jgi:hypothetical protein